MRCSRVSDSGGAPVASMSHACPPTMPRHPAASASSRTMRSRVASGRPGASASTSNARVCNPSPTSTAVASSKAMWHEGRPRRRSSSSMAGRSSWTREYAWTYSIAAAGSTAASSCPPEGDARRTGDGGPQPLAPAERGVAQGFREFRGEVEPLGLGGGKVAGEGVFDRCRETGRDRFGGRPAVIRHRRPRRPRGPESPCRPPSTP